MPAALRHCLSSLRLEYHTQISPYRLLPSKQLPQCGFTTRTYSYSAHNSLESRFRRFDYEISQHDAQNSPSGQLSSQAFDTPNPSTNDSRNGASTRTTRTKKSSRSKENRWGKAITSNAHGQDLHEESRLNRDFAKPRYSPSFFGNQRLYITHNRIQHSTARIFEAQNRFSARSSDQYSGEKAIKALYEAKRIRGMHFQWGYIRHQHPSSEVLIARRAFNSWKLRFWNTMSPKNPSSWPWRGDAEWLFELDNVSAMQRAWEAIEEDTRREEWPLIMLSTLHRCPEKAHLVLAATLNPLPQGYAIHDVLYFIAQHLKLTSIKSVREKNLIAEAVLETLIKVFENLPIGHIPFGQRTFGLFARKLPSDQVHELYTMLRKFRVKLHANTQLHFASTLAKDMAHKEVAFNILKNLAETGIDMNAPSPSSAITSLLHCRIAHGAWSENRSTFSPKDALEYFMERGFVPNVINATAFLDSLCQQSEVEEAIRLALLFSESGVQLDAKVWSIIFRGAKSSLNVRNVVKSFDVAKAAKAPVMNVLNNALHSIFYFAELESREHKLPVPWIYPLFGPMLRTYAKKFELEPLQLWLPDSLPLILAQSTGNDGDKFESPRPRRWDFLESISPLVEGFFSSASHLRKLRPDTTTIAIMIRAYVKTLQHPYDLMAFYTFFKSRLEEFGGRDGFGTQLIKDQGSLIHDTIIMAMTERRGLSRPALQVFGDMLKDHLQRIATNHGEERSHSNQDIHTSIHPPPSLCTFSILVRGLMNGGDRILAEQVIQVMREHGIEPNLVTWNTLVKGYASLQSIKKTVSTLRDMEAAGFKPDLFTFKAFGKLKNQAKALEMMEGIISVNRHKMAGEDLYV